MARKIIIVGGTGGIGAALARLLARDNAQLHLIARDQERLASLASETGATWASADTANELALRAAIAEAGAAIDGLVYAVGPINLKSVAQLQARDIDQDFALNARGAFFAVQAALPGLRAGHHPSVVLFSTVAVQQGFAMHASVAMAKGAVEGLTRALAAELSPAIRVNAIAPSLTRTPLAQRLLASDSLAKAMAAAHPVQRLGEPEDIAQAARFLLSPDSGWMTGQVMAVDGGRGALRVKGQ
ncbi:MAG: SDR family NAD(P)-dependent oxidoreductase [Beijerinckiaceae bacterium]